MIDQRAFNSMLEPSPLRSAYLRVLRFEPSRDWTDLESLKLTLTVASSACLASRRSSVRSG